MGSLDAGLAGLFDYLLKDRETIKAQERDDKQFEKRERLRAKIGLDTKSAEYDLEEKRGGAYQADDGTWVVPLLNGAGKPKGTAPATPAEQAAAESPVVAVEVARQTRDRNKFALDHQVEDRELAVQQTNASIASSNASAAASSGSNKRAQQQFDDERSGTPTAAALSKGYNATLSAIGLANDAQQAVHIRSAFQMAYNAAATPEAKMQVIIEFSAAADRSRSLDSYQQQRELRSLSGGSITPTGF